MNLVKRVGVTEAVDPNNRAMDNKIPSLTCSACNDLDAYQDGVGTRPHIH